MSLNTAISEDLAARPSSRSDPIRPPGARPPPLRICVQCPAEPSRGLFAAAFLRRQVGDRAAVWAELPVEGGSVGLDPLARQVMLEIGIALASEPAAHPPGDADLVITIRNRGQAAPASGTSANILSWSFDDPAALLSAPEAERLIAFRRVRDEIKRRVDLLLLVKRIGRPLAGH